MTNQLNAALQESGCCEQAEGTSGGLRSSDASPPPPRAKTKDQWFAETIQMVSARGYRLTPVYKDGQAKPYANGQTYDDPTDPCWRHAVMVGVVLDDAILLDYDGNKASSDSPIISLDELAEALGLPHLPDPVQQNREGDSLHYLFRFPDDIDEAGYKQANNGGWLPHIDVKRGNQLVNLKPHKLLPAGSLPAKDKLPAAPPNLLNTLYRGPLSASAGEHNQSRWNGSRGEVEEAHEILTYVQVEDKYEPWLDVLMRIHGKFGDTPEGIEVADQWSQQSGHYDHDEIVTKFASFSRADDARPRKSWGALCRRAGDNGADLSAIAKRFAADRSRVESSDVGLCSLPQGASTNDLSCITTPQQLVDRYLFVTSENKYFDEVTRDLHEPVVVDRIHAGRFPGGKNGPKASRAIDTHPHKRMVYGVGWLPSASAVIELDGKELVNTYRDVKVAPAPGPIDDWLHLIQHVSGDYADLLLDHLAYTFQHPDRKIRWQILIVSTVRRTGKSLIFRTIKQLLGRSCKVVTADDMNAGWGDYFHQCKVLIIEELYEREGSKLIEKLKSRLANDDVEALNLKGGSICYQQNLMSMYMTTNHFDALRCDENEDKLLVIQGPDSKVCGDDDEASRAFYDRVADWSDSPEGQAAALDYLRNRDLSDFTPNQLPVRTQALKEMCAASAPDYQRRIAEMIDDRRAPFSNDVTSIFHIRQRLKEEGYHRGSDKGIAEALVKAGWVKKQAQESTGEKRKARYWVQPDSPAAEMTPSELWDHAISLPKHIIEVL